MRIDCHLHTHFSDGSLEPLALLELVRHQRLKAWAITDHDTCSAWRVLKHEPGLISGVEVTGSDDHREVHVVALGIDPDQPAFDAFLAGIRALRRQRFGLLLAHTANHYGHGITLEQALDARSDSPSRVHLARALQVAGCVSHAQNAFRDCLGDEHLRRLGLPTFPDLGTVRQAIHAAGGVAILAHPAVHGSIDRIHQLMRAGNLDGLEINHPNLDPLLKQGLEALVEKYDWLRSCGSDFHWPGRRCVGSWRLSHAEAAPLLQRVAWCDPLEQVAESA